MKKEGSNEQLGKVSLAWVSAISFVIFIGSAMAQSKGMITSDHFLSIELVAMLVGIGIVLCVIEIKLIRHLKSFSSARLGWIAIISIGAFWARAKSVDEINSIFHVDAGALPMTVIAGSVIELISWSLIPFIVALLYFMPAGFSMLRGTYFPDNVPWDKRLPDQIITYYSFITLGICAILSYAQFHTEGERHQKLYRIAHMTDFSASFDCVGLDSSKFDGLFIGPAQTQMLIAPKLPNEIENQAPNFLKRVLIPEKFLVTQCIHEKIQPDEISGESSSPE